MNHFFLLFFFKNNKILLTVHMYGSVGNLSSDMHSVRVDSDNRNNHVE